jgi:hypothetical protein
MTKLAALLSALLLAAASSSAQDWKKKIDQQRVNEAVKKGTDFMLQMSAGGCSKFPHPDLQKLGQNVELSYCELIYLTLWHGGVDPADPNMKRLLKYMLKNGISRTYNAALQAMVLQKLDPWKYHERIAYIARFLVLNQCENGQWSYGEPIDEPVPTPRKEVASGTGGGERDPDPAVKPVKAELDRVVLKDKAKGPPTGDNSNSQYAALGIRACHDANIRFPKETIAAAQKWWESSQNKDGGWGYQKDEASYASMTAGAVGALAIYNFVNGAAPNGGTAQGKGITWLAGNFSVTENAKYQYAKVHYFYFMYALERAGVYLNQDYLGKRDWYAEGCNRLLEDQKKNGSWGDNMMVDTCFAILFLRRASNPLRPVATSVERKPVADEPEDK